MDYKNQLELYELEQKERSKRIYDFVVISLKLREMRGCLDSEDILFSSWIDAWDNYADRKVISGDY